MTGAALLFWGSLVLAPLALVGQVLLSYKKRLGWAISAGMNLVLVYYNLATGQPFWVIVAVPSVVNAVLAWRRWSA